MNKTILLPFFFLLLVACDDAAVSECVEWLTCYEECSDELSSPSDCTNTCGPPRGYDIPAAELLGDSYYESESYYLAAEEYRRAIHLRHLCHLNG